MSRKEFIAEYMPIDPKSAQPRMRAEILAWDLDDARIEARKAADPGYKLTCLRAVNWSNIRHVIGT